MNLRNNDKNFTHQTENLVYKIIVLLSYLVTCLSLSEN